MSQRTVPQAERPVHDVVRAAVPAAPATRILRPSTTAKRRPSQVPATLRLPAAPGLTVQCCKTISSPGDELEREARSVANAVTGPEGPPPPADRAAAQPCPCQAGGKQLPVQRASRQPGPEVSEHGLVQAMRVASAGGGTPLPGDVR